MMVNFINVAYVCVLYYKNCTYMYRNNINYYTVQNTENNIQLHHKLQVHSCASAIINPTCGNTMIVNGYCAESKTLPDLHVDLLKVFHCLWNGMSRMTSCWYSGVNLITINSHYFGKHYFVPLPPICTQLYYHDNRYSIFFNNSLAINTHLVSKYLFRGVEVLENHPPITSFLILNHGN